GHGCAWEVCTNCKGATKMKSDFGSRCSSCKGLAYINKEQSSCRTCGGSGRVKVLKEVNVTIPAGIDTGDIISIPRAGSVGIRGKPHTLKLKLKVAEDTVFKREGSNLYVDSKISYSQVRTE
ncbi:chaperone protein DnaJ, partial [Tanacetum coccineum]